MPQFRLLSALEKSGFLSAAQSRQVENQVRQRSISLQQALSEISSIDTQQLSQHCSALFHLPLCTPDPTASRQLMDQLNLTELCKEWLAIPVQQNDQWLTLAVTDPTNSDVVNAFQFSCGLCIDLVIGDINQILPLLHHKHASELHEPQLSHYQIDMEAQLSASLPEEDPDNIDDPQQNNTPIGQFVHQVILTALNQQASDIHFEPYEHHYRIRMRIDGLLVTTHNPNKKLSRRLASRIKILARLNIAERRLPQDGRLKIAINRQQSLDIRVSTLPTLWGEKIVLRLLGSSNSALPINQLGLNETQSRAFHRAINQPQGLILITGPTGSGKTTTLYSALQQLNQEQRNISTVEDPIEIQLAGINQIQTHDQIGLSFAAILRSLLRQDPDVIMLGEIRDKETAQMAIRAAQTGHLVLSTLHTNSAADALIRLHQIGIPLYQLLASLKLVIAQRLVRKLCPHCKQPQSHHYQASATGCPHCFSGFKGRVAVYDFFSLDQLPSLTPSGESSLDSATQRGCRLWRHGLELIDQGITSLGEIQRVIELPEIDLHGKQKQTPEISHAPATDRA